MANGGALINEGLWRRDREFQQLPRLAQCTFCQVLSQKDLDTAGVLTLHLELLAKGCDEITVDQLRADFVVLERARFVFVDYETDELLVRSYVRRVSARNRNCWLSVPKNSRMVGSLKLRHELASELRRVGRRDATDLADEIDPVPTPSGPGPDGVPTPSGPDTPSRPRLDGDSLVPVLVLESPSVVGHLGERPPCKDHLENSETNCHACRRRREWDERHEADELEHKRAARAAAALIAENCHACHGTNVVEVGEDRVRKCDHGRAHA